ncbi:methyl-accepting chemotaxis protein [uncultured Clostridium sp.]|uniref:methyl-accepting chemotaxis protein n=1 Tax=uncultured Clostridium sp. TaxID=59620 RepID=UPI0025D07297|nr:methyl-accepting chemotaxis protein [uncultured Clostridium sp.]
MEKKNRKSIKIKLTRTMLLAVIIPLVLVSGLTVWNLKFFTNKNFESNNEILSTITKDRINETIQRYGDLLQKFIDNDQTIGVESEYANLEKNEKLIARSDNKIVAMYFANDKKDMIESSDDKVDSSYDPTSRQWYIDAKKQTPNIAVGSPYVNLTTKQLVITISKTVERNGEFIGVVGVDIDLNTLSKQLSKVKYGETGEMNILDSEGNVIISSDESLIGENDKDNYKDWETIANSVKGRLNYKYKDEIYESYYNTEEVSGWKIILKTTAKEVRSGELSVILNLAIALVVLVVIVGLIIRAIAFYLSKNITLTIEKLQEASKGNLNAYLEIKSNDEFKDLEENYNGMLNNIKKLIKRVDDSTVSVSTTSEKLANMSDEVSSSMELVSQTIEQITSGTVESANDLQSISNDMDSLSKSMNNMENTTVKVNTMAVKTDELGQNGIEIVKKLMNKSSDTKSAIKMLDEVVRNVAEGVKEVGKMNEVISEITNQTNMLALNAAIESARAGEVGKGFAVVAEEIRQLAEETAETAKKIDEVIKNINSITEEVVEDVKNTVNVVEEQEEVVSESEIVFNNVISSVEDLTSNVNIIASEIKGINKMKNAVADKLQNLSAIMEETAAGAEEVSASASEVSNSAIDFTKSSRELQNLSKDLKDEVEVFQL